MVGVVRTAMGEGSVLVLCDPVNAGIEEIFKILSIGTNRELKVVDSQGRVFINEGGKSDLWIHPLVMIRLPDENLNVATKYGYKVKVEVHVNDNYKVHAPYYLRNSPLYAKLPAWARV